MYVHRGERRGVCMYVAGGCRGVDVSYVCWAAGGKKKEEDEGSVCMCTEEREGKCVCMRYGGGCEICLVG